MMNNNVMDLNFIKKVNGFIEEGETDQPGQQKN